MHVLRQLDFRAHRVASRTYVGSRGARSGRCRGRQAADASRVMGHGYYCNLSRGEAPKKCSTFLSGFKHKMKIISITKRGASHFSSDLVRAPGARSIAVEKCEAPLLVTEIWQRAYPDILRSHDHFMGASPRNPRQKILRFKCAVP